MKLKRILYLGWLGRANVGDEVLFEIFKRGVQQYIADHDMQLVVDIDAWQSHKGYEQSVHHYDMVVLGGGSIFHIGHWLTICQAAQKASVATISWGTGIDALSTSSINLIPPATEHLLQSVLANMQYISCRGAYTAKWLGHFIPVEQVNVLGDPALSYRPPDYLPEQLLPPHKRSNTIYVNWGTSANQILGQNEKELEKKLVVALTKLMKAGFNVVIIPIWVEDKESCTRLAEKIAHKNCQLIPNVLAADRLFHVLRQCRYAICLKLHAAILCAAAGCLPVSLAYRFKCIELMDSIGLGKFALTTDNCQPAEIVSCIETYAGDTEKYALQLSEQTEKNRALVARSLQDIIGLLTPD